MRVNVLERITTSDGSWTLRDAVRDITYRSVHGAETESDMVFVNACATGRRPRPWRVLELGFGAAMNFHRTLSRCVAMAQPLEYVAIERSPVDPELISHGEITDQLTRTALATPGRSAITGAMSLTVHCCDWRDDPVEGSYDAIFHDPFGPKDDPESWTQDCFRWHRSRAHGRTVLATYSVAGHVRRAMEHAGWRVEKHPGPRGKREVLTATLR